MSNRPDIAFDSALWQSVKDYANGRIDELTDVCTSEASSDQSIRAAQAAIAELKILISLQSKAKASARPSQMGGY